MGYLNFITNKKRTISTASAGEINKLIPIQSTNVTLPSKIKIKNEDGEIDTSQFLIYKVVGNSMCTSHIFDNNFVFAKACKGTDEKLNIPSLSTIVFTVDKEREKRRHNNINENDIPQYKLRKFVMYIDLRNPDDNNIFAGVLNLDLLSAFQGEREVFMKKIAEAREEFKESLVILSTTYKEGARDYSFHSLDLLNGIVEYCSSNSEFEEVERVTSVNDDPKLYQEMVYYLAVGNHKRFFYCINDEQAIIVISQIFNSSREIIRLISNKLSPEITGNKLYRQSLISFLEKENTKLYILVYEYETDNPIYELLQRYQEKVFIRHSASSKLILKGQVVNFCIGDNHMFRLETNIESRLAQCNFYDPDACRNLIEKFEIIFEDCDLIR